MSALILALMSRSPAPQRATTLCGLLIRLIVVRHLYSEGGSLSRCRVNARAANAPGAYSFQPSGGLLPLAIWRVL